MLCPRSGCGASMDRDLVRSITIVLIDDEAPPAVDEGEADDVVYTCPRCGHVETTTEE